MFITRNTCFNLIMQNSDNAWLLGVTDVMHYSIFDCMYMLTHIKIISWDALIATRLYQRSLQIEAHVAL